jgi:hypothetical protein
VQKVPERHAREIEIIPETCEYFFNTTWQHWRCRFGNMRPSLHVAKQNEIELNTAVESFL